MSSKYNKEIVQNRNFSPLPDPRGERPDKSTAYEERKQCNKRPREWVIGDPHIFDPNVILYHDRPFKSVGEMNAYIVKQWNGVVEDEDTVFVLGDFVDFHHCKVQEAYDILDQLNGNIILIKGNHDDHLHYFHDYGIQVIEYPILKDEFWIMSHEPIFVTETAPYANIFAHVHTNPMYKTVSSRSFCVSAERHDYTPVLLSSIKTMIINCANGRGDGNEVN